MSVGLPDSGATSIPQLQLILMGSSGRGTFDCSHAIPDERITFAKRVAAPRGFKAEVI
jgi:hypothetical protein